MAGTYVLPGALLEILQAPRPGLQREQRLGEILDGVPADTAHGDAISLNVPLQDGPGHQFESLAERTEMTLPRKVTSIARALHHTHEGQNDANYDREPIPERQVPVGPGG